MIWILVGLLIFQMFGTESLAAQLHDKPIFLTLEECVDTVIQNSSSVLKNQNDFAFSGEQLLESYGQFLPNLNASSSYYYNSGKTLYTFSGSSLVDLSARNTTLDFSTRLNLFNGFSDFSGLKSALARKQSAQMSLAWAKDQVALDLIQTYLRLILDQNLVDIAKKNLEASEGRLKLFQESTKVGAASVADLYRQQAQTSSDKLLLSTYESRLNDDQTLLIRKLRIDPDKNYEFVSPPLEVLDKNVKQLSKPISRLVSEALESRSDLKSANYRSEYTDWNITQNKSGYYPKLDLIGTRSAAGHYLIQQSVNGIDTLPLTQRSLIPQLGDQVTYAVFLSLSWNIFDRFLTRKNVSQAQMIHDNAQIDLTDVKLQIESDVRIARNDFLIAQEQQETTKVGLSATLKAFEAIQGRYRVGQSNFIDVLTSQTALIQAQSNQVQARINLKLQEKSLEYSLGVLLVKPSA